MVANGQEINITVDGKKITTSPGKTVLEAALESQIYIPYLCYHPGMKPFAACRMCMVREEVEMEVDQDGQKVKQKVLRPATASCALPVRDGMVIKSNTDEIRELQTDIMEMVIAEHPHGCLTCHRIDLCGPGDICLRHVSVNDRCVTCPKNERCELKDTVRFLGMDINSPLNYQTRNLPVENGDPFYDRDYNLCIVCARCVRVCEEVRGDSAITFLERAGQSLVGTSNGTSLMQSGCEFCGACIDVCPVGALVETDNKWEKSTNVEKTICNLCPVGCQINLEFNSRDKMIRAIPELNSPVNKGQACFRGKFGSSYMNTKRNTNPKIRVDQKLTDISLQSITEEIANNISTMKPDETAVLVAPNISNESAYIVQKFARSVLKTNNILSDTDNSSVSIVPLINRIGFAGATNDIWNIENTDTIILLNANITEEYNILGIPIKNAQRKGANVITIDTRETESSSIANTWIRPKPGSDLILLHSIINSLITTKSDRSNFFDGINPEDYTNSLIGNIEELTGVSELAIQDIVEKINNSGSVSLLYSSDNISFNNLEQYVDMIIDLSILSENIFTQEGGLYPLSQGSNQQGLIDMGCRSEVLPGHTLSINQNPDLGEFNYTEFSNLFKTGKLKNIFIIGDIESFSNDHILFQKPNKDSIDYIYLLSPTYSDKLQEISQYIIPTNLHTEEIGTFTNLEKKVQISDNIVKSSPDLNPIWKTLCNIAKHCGATEFNFNSSSEVMSEISNVVFQYKDISHQKLNSNAKVILKPQEDNPLPTQLLHSERILIGMFWAHDIDLQSLKITSVPQITVNDQDNSSLILIPGRVLFIEGTEIETNAVTNKNTVINNKILTISYNDAANLSLIDGDKVNITNKSISTTAQVKIDAKWHEGFVSCTDLFAEYMSVLEEDKSFYPMLKPGKLNYQAVSISKAN